MLKLKLFSLLIISTILFSSCFTELVQKAYITNPPNVCLFDSARDLKVRYAANLRYIENQSSFAINDRSGIATSLLIGVPSKIGIELGYVYYKKLNHFSYFELNSGYGYFDTESKVGSDAFPTYSMKKDNFIYFHDIKSEYHKLYVQPSYFLLTRYFDIGLTSRVSLPYFTDYNCQYSLSVVNKHESGHENYFTFYKHFKNKVGFTIEPMLMFRFKGKHQRVSTYLQIGACYAPMSVKADSVYVNPDAINDGYSDKQPFPLHANFFINYGLEIKIGKIKYY